MRNKIDFEGLILIAFATMVHGINLCYARLSEISDKADGEYFSQVGRYLSPPLAVLAAILLAVGIVRLILAWRKK